MSCKPSAAAPIRPLAQELPYASGTAQEKKKERKKKKNEWVEKKKKKMNEWNSHCGTVTLVDFRGSGSILAWRSGLEDPALL